MTSCSRCGLIQAKLGLGEAEAVARPFLASMGIYVFKYDRLEQLLAEDPNAVDFGKEIIPSAINAGHVEGYLFDGYWEDIGTITAFYRANLDLTSKIPKFNLFDAEAPVFTRARYLPPSKVEESQIVESILSDGCIVLGATITNSVVGLRSRISKGVRIDSSFLMGADYYQTIEEMRDDVVANKPRVGIGRELSLIAPSSTRTLALAVTFGWSTKRESLMLTRMTVPITFATESLLCPRML